MNEQGVIKVVDTVIGYAHARPCYHAWRLRGGHTIKFLDPCPVCAEIKAARMEGMEAGGKMAADLKALAPVFKFYLPASVSEFDKRIAELEAE